MYGGALWGTYDESANENSFKEAIQEWRGEPAKLPADQTTEVGEQAEIAAPKEKRSCWQCYKLHWSDVSLSAEGHTDKVFCSPNCLGKFQEKESLKAAQKKALADKAERVRS